MISKISMKTGLLPNYFKKIGIALCVITFIPPIIIKAAHINLTAAQKDLAKLLCGNAFLLGLFFIAWAKDRIEDEMTIALRLRSLAWAFSWAVLYLILYPFTYLMFCDSPIEMSGVQVMMSMNFVYLLAYNYAKLKR